MEYINVFIRKGRPNTFVHILCVMLIHLVTHDIHTVLAAKLSYSKHFC